MSDKNPNLKKKLSGHEYRKRKAEKEEQFKQNKKLMSIEKYIVQKKQTEDNANVVPRSSNLVLTDSGESITLVKLGDNDQSSINSNPEMEENQENKEIDNFKDLSEEKLKDCGNWPVFLSHNIIDHLIEIGPIQITMNKFPDNAQGRHFSSCYYHRKLLNGESFCRRWLVYSISKNAIFCFCCKIFDWKSTSKLANSGYNNWQHLSEAVSIHENSASHRKFYQQWVETEMRIKTGQTIDKKEQEMIEKEKSRWQNVLLRLLNITLYLAQNNIAFRGTSDKLYTPHNGKFLGLVQLLAKFDPVMENHLSLAMKSDISDHYCGKNIQNELISLMAEKVNHVIALKALKAIYYSIIADCTPDNSRKEQLSLTIRFVDLSDDTLQVKEHFVGFFSVDDTSGLGLTEVLMEKITKLGLEMKNCRGQGYDNGSNMKGKKMVCKKEF